MVNPIERDLAAGRWGCLLDADRIAHCADRDGLAGKILRDRVAVDRPRDVARQGVGRRVVIGEMYPNVAHRPRRDLGVLVVRGEDLGRRLAGIGSTLRAPLAHAHAVAPATALEVERRLRGLRLRQLG
jgi:hypothetical protein